jgi:hypothetical protein
MAALQMMRMKQDMQQQYLQNRAGGLYGNITRAAPGGDVLSQGVPDPYQRQLHQAGQMAEALTSERDLSQDPFYTRKIAQNIGAIGPAAAQAGLMQAGQMFGRPGGAREISQVHSQPIPPPGPLNPSGMMVPEIYTGPQSLGINPIGGRSAAAGGRVPSTGTYKLHKGEVVVPKKAADVLFPYVAKGEEQKKLKAKGKYPPDYELRFRARKGKIKDSYQGGAPERDMNWWLKNAPIAMPYRFLSGAMGAPEGSSAMRRLGEGIYSSYEPYAEAAVEGPSMLGELYGGLAGRPAIPPSAGPPPPAGLPEAAEGAPPVAPPDAPPSLSMSRGGFEFTGEEYSKTRSKADEIASIQTAADIAERTVDQMQQRNDVLMRYLDEQTTPNPQLIAMIKDRERSIKYHKGRAEELKEKAGNLTAQEVAKSMTLTEAQGKIIAAEIKAKGEAGEAQAKRFEAAQEGYLDILAKFQAGDIDEDQFRQTIMALYGPGAVELAQSQGISKVDALEGLSEIALSIAGGDVNAAAEMTGMLRQMHQSGRLGG